MPDKGDTNQPVSKNGETGVPGKTNHCGTCKKSECSVQIANKTSQKWISCDQCSIWYHGMCQGLQPVDVNAVIKLETLGVRWYCDQCRPNIAPATNSISGVENSSMISKLNNLEQTMQKFTQTYADAARANTERIQKLEQSCETTLKETSQNIKKAVQVNQSAEKMMAKNNAQNEIEARKNNAILYGIEEKENTTAIQQIQELMRLKLYLHCSIPLQAIRIGRRTEDKTRPILLKFSDESTKWEFLKRTNAKDTRTPGVFCKLDTSKEVRDKEFQLRAQIRQLKGDEENANTQYRIRTKESMIRIEQRLPEGEWCLLNPAANQTEETTC